MSVGADVEVKSDQLHATKAMAVEEGLSPVRGSNQIANDVFSDVRTRESVENRAWPAQGI